MKSNLPHNKTDASYNFRMTAEMSSIAGTTGGNNINKPYVQIFVAIYSDCINEIQLIILPPLPASRQVCSSWSFRALASVGLMFDEPKLLT